ncbi:MAG: DoxX family protein [Isosphaeraceae bacterium]
MYYPGFFGALFLLLLRTAVGWHFLYEGVWKYESWQKGDKPFTAEPYLRNATGPLAPYFRGMVPDVNGLAKLDPERLQTAWSAEVDRVAAHYGFNDDQKAKAAAELSKAQEFADKWFLDRENRENRTKYYHDLAAVQTIERNPDALENERLWAWNERKTLDTARKDLTKPLNEREAALRDAVVKLATPEQAQSAGPAGLAKTTIDLNNAFTIGSLLAIGSCLLLGFLTRPAALGGAAFLAMIYLAMPPWPGLPPNPLENGHYLIVDRNLVEMIACLALAALPTGHWIGLDALFFGWLRRSREARRSARERGARGRERAAQAVS